MFSKYPDVITVGIGIGVGGDFAKVFPHSVIVSNPDEVPKLGFGAVLKSLKLKR